MQLGARWRAGTAPHHGVPELLHAAIAEQEAAHPAASGWTLTWLEGQPRCALEDDGFEPLLTVTLDAAGNAVLEGGARASAQGDAGASAQGDDWPAGDGGLTADDENDDDWLR